MKNQSDVPDDLSDAINAIIVDINKEIINNTEGNEARNPNAGEHASKLLDTSGNYLNNEILNSNFEPYGS